MSKPNVLPQNVNKRYRISSAIVTCTPRPIMEREKVCKHTLLKRLRISSRLQQQRLRPREQHSDASISKVAYGGDCHAMPRAIFQINRCE